ncbi:PfkB family carbohydrate kinase [Pedobacter aquatilis]|uniref:PfkB family carbohydrate kinase n=1 Tax=Pedobacter aquatilis TaxID=351343 RepID=UPI00292FA524|nr:PfkB family carbohydrate kinase [Pedobacter aquatilis]
MMADLDIIGGTYLEICIDPVYKELFGSGLRAAIALSNYSSAIRFHTGIGSDDEELLRYKSSLFGFEVSIIDQPNTINFIYEHPLRQPEAHYLPEQNQSIDLGQLDKVLYYGMIETDIKVNAEMMVYDPQNQIPFHRSGATAKKFALILNKQEALSFVNSEKDLEKVGKILLKREEATVIVIKNGSAGALVFEGDKVDRIPVFRTSHVWPIGSGDVFSAVFAHQWMILGKSAFDSAMKASVSVAQFCETKQLQFDERKTYFPPEIKSCQKKIYLAAPFFTMGERMFLNEVRYLLQQFENSVFSPYHDAGVVDGNPTVEEVSEIAKADLEGIDQSDIVLAIYSGTDPGTIFEIGYARAKGIPVVALCENVKGEDLFMLEGTGCTIVHDLSTAIYTASW